MAAFWTYLVLAILGVHVGSGGALAVQALCVAKHAAVQNGTCMAACLLGLLVQDLLVAGHGAVHPPASLLAVPRRIMGDGLQPLLASLSWWRDEDGHVPARQQCVSAQTYVQAEPRVL